MMRARYLQPGSLPEALAALDGGGTILAGGTDFHPARDARAAAEDIIDITRIPELRRIEAGTHAVRIGATVTWSDVAAASLPPAFDGLKAAAREVGGAQIQNVGTVAGNLCNASPAADGVPALLALDARVELASRAGTRSISLAQFLLGPRRTARAPDELVTAVIVPAWPPGARGSFLKLGHRRYLVISIAMVSAVVACDATGRVTRAAVAVGACSAVARRLPALEARLPGMPGTAAPESVQASDLDVLAPIDDVRGTAEYRIEAARVLVRRALAQVVA
ncbi:MAG: FAD binding domain-containing protein [Burkholderiales bacterium]|nr:FAD binding domain-containing protein [Burkholderiales bacterium]